MPHSYALGNSRAKNFWRHAVKSLCIPGTATMHVYAYQIRTSYQERMSYRMSSTHENFLRSLAEIVASYI